MSAIDERELQGKTDDELRELAEQSRKLLAQREKAKKDAAIAQIKKIASENDLVVDVRPRAPRRRGRPRGSGKKPETLSS